MKCSNKLILRNVLFYEYAGFMFCMIVIWLNEIVDIPHLLFGAPKTYLNWPEALFESFLIALIGCITISNTKFVLNRLRFLEGMLQVCASCKKIRTDEGAWKQIETYVSNHSDASFTHGICPSCAEKLYPDFNPYCEEGSAVITNGRDDRPGCQCFKEIIT
jgi:hypothetical protein